MITAHRDFYGGGFSGKGWVGVLVGERDEDIV